MSQQSRGCRIGPGIWSERRRGDAARCRVGCTGLLVEAVDDGRPIPADRGDLLERRLLESVRQGCIPKGLGRVAALVERPVQEVDNGVRLLLVMVDIVLVLYDDDIGFGDVPGSVG